ncbi:YkvA family protein [Massilia sp. DD77]
MSTTEKLRTWARNIKRDGVTLWFAYKNPETPWFAKALCVLVVAYALSPIDLIPDFMPVLGYLDDLILLPCLIWLAVRLIPESVLAQCRVRADEWITKEGRAPKNKWGIVFVLAVWILVAWVTWRYAVSPFL